MSAIATPPQLVEMTPNDAGDILSNCTVDRTPDWTTVFNLAAKIMFGWWVPGMGKPIEVNRADGRLINGQHRLIAIVFASRPVEVELVEVTS